MQKRIRLGYWGTSFVWLHPHSEGAKGEKVGKETEYRRHGYFRRKEVLVWLLAMELPIPVSPVSSRRGLWRSPCDAFDQ